MLSAADGANLPTIGGVLILCGLVGLRFLVLYARGDFDIHDPPREKRTYLFETDDGERYNPFAADDADRTEDHRCPVCGHVNDEDYHYCSECTAQLPTSSSGH